MPIEFFDTDDFVAYEVEKEDGTSFSLLDKNNVKALNAFKNMWVNIEYIKFNSYSSLDEADVTFFVLSKINDQNPILMPQ